MLTKFTKIQEMLFKLYMYQWIRKINLLELDTFVKSTKFTQLLTVLKLINLKVINEWVDKTFIELLFYWRTCCQIEIHHLIIITRLKNSLYCGNGI